MDIQKNIRQILTAILLLAFCSSISSQQILKGVVTDKADNMPLPGANIIIKNTNNRILEGTTTDPDGKYTVIVSEDNLVLQVTFIGYKPKEFEIGNREEINVELEPQTTALDEVVVTASKSVSNGYMNIDQENLASSVTTVDMEKIAGSSATSVTEMLQGRTPGVLVTANSGDPGAGFSIKIRGSSSLNSTNNPLIIIDNVPYDQNVNITSIADLTSSHSPLSDVNPSDIEDITILKDAAATAIYGSRGANGVVLITTKRGRSNQTIISYNTKFSVQRAPQNIPLLNGDDMKTLILEGMQNSGQYVNDPENQPFMELRDDPTRNDYYLYNNNTDWLDAIQQRGYTYDNSFSLRGGGETTTYRFSLGTTNQTGTTRGTGYDRLTGSFNLDYSISDKLSFKSSTGFTRSKTVTSEIKDVQNPNVTAAQYPAFLPIYRIDQNGKELDDYYIQSPDRENTLYDRNMYNPYAWTDLVTLNRRNNSFRSNLQFIVEVVENLNFISRIAIDFSANNNDFVVPYEATNRDLNDAMINRFMFYDPLSQNIVQENILSYQKNIQDNHEFTITAVSKYNWWKEYTHRQEGSNSGNPAIAVTNRINELSSGTGTVKGSSMIGSFHYKMYDKYILQGTLNYEGSSKFGPSNRFAFFPTLAAAWKVSNEQFMQGLSSLDELKLRYSWGTSGNPPWGNYLYFSTYSAGVRYLDQVGVTPDNIQLNTLKWETTTTHNLAFDLAMFRNRLKLTTEVFKKYTNDLLMVRELPTTSGYGNFWSNFGDVENKGMEISTSVRVIDATLKWDVDFNISMIKNKIVYVPDDWNNTVDEDNGFFFITKEGDAIGSVYGYVSDGVFPRDEDAVVKDADGNIVYELDGEPKIMLDRNNNEFEGGDANYRDINHDGIINDEDIVKIGDANPDFIGGTGTRLSFNSWELSVLFQYQVGNDLINIAKKDLESMPGGVNRNRNQATSVLRRWRKQGDITDIPRVNFDENNHNNYGSTRFIEDGSFLRMKSLALSYNLPSDMVSKLKIKNANVFFNAYNILTFTNYTGADPEISISSDNPGKIGLDKGQTAVPKSFTVGFKFTF